MAGGFTACHFFTNKKSLDMKYSEAKKLITELAGRNGEEFSDDEKKSVEEVYTQIFKKRIENCNCKNKWHDACVKMAIWFKEHKAFNTCHYVIQAGEAFMVGMKYYNNSNLTDEVAEKLIESNPRAAQLIQRVALPSESGKEEISLKIRKK